MQASRTHWAKGLLTLTAAIGIPWVAGCDNPTSSADRTVLETVAEGAASYRESNDAEARARFEAAAREADASPAMKAYAKSTQAQAEVDAAQALLTQIDQRHTNIARLAWDIQQLTDQIGGSLQVAASFSKLDPQSSREDINRKIEEVRGGADKDVWITTDSATIPTLTAVTQTISRLDSAITQREEQLKGLQQKRAESLTQAEEAQRASQESKGEQSVQLHNRGADLRKQAAELFIQIDATEAALVPLQRDLAVAKAQEEVLNETIASYQEQLKTIDAKWSEVQTQIQAQTRQARSMSNGDAESIASKTAELTELVEANEESRRRAVLFLNDASTHYAEAATAADLLKADLTGRINAAGSPPVQTAGWRETIAIFNSAQYIIRQGRVQHLLGNAHAGQARSLKLRLDLGEGLAKVYQQSDLRVPEALNASSLSGELTTAVGDARAAYGEANEKLGTVASGSIGTPEMRSAASVARSLALYGWALFEREMGNATEARQHLADAKAAAQEAVQGAGGADPREFPTELRAGLRTVAPDAPGPPAPPAMPGDVDVEG